MLFFQIRMLFKLKLMRSGWGGVTDARHGVVAITFCAFFMQVFVEASSWWYVAFLTRIWKYLVILYVCVPFIQETMFISKGLCICLINCVTSLWGSIASSYCWLSCFYTFNTFSHPKLVGKGSFCPLRKYGKPLEFQCSKNIHVYKLYYEEIWEFTYLDGRWLDYGYYGYYNVFIS